MDASWPDRYMDTLYFASSDCSAVGLMMSPLGPSEYTG